MGESFGTRIAFLAEGKSSEFSNSFLVHMNRHSRSSAPGKNDKNMKGSEGTDIRHGGKCKKSQTISQNAVLSTASTPSHRSKGSPKRTNTTLKQLVDPYLAVKCWMDVITSCGGFLVMEGGILKATKVDCSPYILNYSLQAIYQVLI